MKTGKNRIERFDFSPGTVLAKKYRVISKLGEGWESEVYIIREKSTRIERAAKIFFPQRNRSSRVATIHARKMHKLRNCPIVIQYHSKETIKFEDTKVSMLISDYVEGEVLSEFLARQRGKRISAFQGLHLLYALANGISCIHANREYHGDLHPENIIVHRYGLGFDLKALDFFHWGPPNRQNLQDDIVDVIKIFYQAIGGKRLYASQPAQVKEICCGLKRKKILAKFSTMAKLKHHLETMEWGEVVS